MRRYVVLQVFLAIQSTVLPYNSLVTVLVRCIRRSSMIAEAHATRVEHLLLLFVFTAILDTHLHLTIAYVLLGDRAAFQLLLLFYLFLFQSPIILFLLVLHEALEHGALLQLGGCSSLHRRNSRKGRIAILSVARATRERGLLAARGAARRSLCRLCIDAIASVQRRPALRVRLYLHRDHLLSL